MSPNEISGIIAVFAIIIVSNIAMYEKGYNDGVNDTIAEIKKRFHIGEETTSYGEKEASDDIS